MRSRKWLVAALTVGCAGLAYVTCIYRFLALDEPVPARILVVEGWIADAPQVRDLPAIIAAGGYESVVCVAVEEWPEGTPGLVPSARRAANRLVALGLDSRRLTVLAAFEIKSAHTYHNAMEVKRWLQQEQPAATSINIYTAGVHARKSRLIYAKVLGPHFRVGVIPARAPEFPHSCWWLSERGIYVVLRNTAGYLYAVFSSPPAR